MLGLCGSERWSAGRDRSGSADQEKEHHMAEFVGALDQGTTSTRFMIFDHDGREVAQHQLEHAQILARAGWVEHDPAEIWRRAEDVIDTALDRARLTATDLVAVGVANQRETTVVWDQVTGRPLYNAIVWQDTRTDRIAASLERDGRGQVIRQRAGLPPAAYFSGGKLQWLLENVGVVREAADAGRALFGTVDTWLIWNLTGGTDGGVHVTDPTNASRTMLMDLETLQWDDELLSFFGVRRSMLPQIRPSSDPDLYGTTLRAGPLRGEVPVAAGLGDQQAATVGQVCFEVGEAKNTYGTGNFLLLNTGNEIVRSKNGLVTTVCYQFGSAPPVYALEGSIAVTGSAIQWLRDQLGIIGNAEESEALARSVDDTEGLAFVPAFSGLFAPYWRPDARGAIVGMSRFHNRAHIAKGGARSDLLPVQGRRRRDGAGQRRHEPGHAGGRRRHGQRPGDAAAGRRPGGPYEPARGRGDDRPGRCVCRRARHRFLAEHGRTAHELARVPTLEPQWTPERRENGYRQWRKAVDRTLNWGEVS